MKKSKPYSLVTKIESRPVYHSCKDVGGSGNSAGQADSLQWCTIKKVMHGISHALELVPWPCLPRGTAGMSSFPV